MFLLLWCCMWMTAATELGTDQWVGSLITNLTGMQGVLILVYTAGIMFVLRFFGGSLAHRFSPMGLMTLCAILSAIGLYGLGKATYARRGLRRGDAVRRGQDVLLAGDAGRHRRAVSQRRRAAAGHHGRHRQSRRRLHPAGHGRLVRHRRRRRRVPLRGGAARRSSPSFSRCSTSITSPAAATAPWRWSGSSRKRPDPEPDVPEC